MVQDINENIEVDIKTEKSGQEEEVTMDDIGWRKH